MMVSSIVKSYLLADQNQKLLEHLLSNAELLGRWNGSYAASGANTLRFSLYMHILSEMRAIMFDTHKKVASVHNIVTCLKDVIFREKLREWFCDTRTMEVFSYKGVLTEDDKEPFRAAQRKSKSTGFDELINIAIVKYELLRQSEISNRIIDARDKMISHKEFRSAKIDERRVFQASDFGLVYSDSKDIIEKSHEIIFSLYSLFSKSHFDSKHSVKHHELVAKEFWSQ